VVHSVVYDDRTGRATGVRVVDARTKQTREYRARLVFLCASALNSTRILLNSRTTRHSAGLGNASGVLGRYVMDHHFKVGARGEVPGLEDVYYQGNRPNGVYVPRFRNLGDAATRRPDFLRGYGYQGSASRASWSRGAGEPGFGLELKRRLRDPGGWSMNLGAFGECLPRADNRVELADATDPFGIPQLRVHVTWGPNELAMRKDMAAAAAEMLEAGGCRNVKTNDELQPDGYGAEPGLGIHEMGGARMGRDPGSSVLNAHNQVWDAPNVFVTDGACMTSSSCVNPSITYMALTARAVDHAVREMKRRNL
jgi:choline dehydrogenase-like flavoprotein